MTLLHDLISLEHRQEEGDGKGHDHRNEEHGKARAHIGDAGDKAGEGKGNASRARKACDAAAHRACDTGGEHGPGIADGHAKEGRLRHAEGAGEGCLIRDGALLLFLGDQA